MYLAAIEEGRNHEAESAMTAHIQDKIPRTLTPE